MPRRCLLAALVTAALAATAQADDWPQWLGPKRDGVWREGGILDKFPRGGPKVLWRIPVGPGYSGPAVVGDRVYLTDRVPEGKEKPFPPRGGPGKERVLCLDARDGKEIWKHEYDCRYTPLGGYPSGPRVTPTIEGGKLYTLGAMGRLLCLDAATGKEMWAKELAKEYAAKVPVWGWSGHPLVDGDRLFCIVGGAGSAAVAFDRHTGKELWKALDSEEIGYAPPILVEAGGRKQVVVWLSESLNGLDAETGKVLWTVPYPEDGMPTRPAVNIMTPQVVNGAVYVSAFYHGTLAVKLDDRKPDAKLLWRSKSNNPAKPDVLHAVMTTPTVKDGHVYGMCGWGELRCFEAATGKALWETKQPFAGDKALFGTSFIVEQGGRHFLFTDHGDLIIAKLTPKGYEEIDRAKVLRPTQEARGRTVVWSHPAFAGRCMFARNDEELVCYSLAAGK